MALIVHNITLGSALYLQKFHRKQLVKVEQMNIAFSLTSFVLIKWTEISTSTVEFKIDLVLENIFLKTVQGNNETDCHASVWLSAKWIDQFINAIHIYESKDSFMPWWSRKALQERWEVSSILQAELVVSSRKGLLGGEPTRASPFHESGDWSN